MKKSILIIYLIIFLSCAEEKKDIVKLSLRFNSFESSNRDLKEMIDKYYVSRKDWNHINNSIINLFEIVDEGCDFIVVKSGGYNSNSFELTGASRKDIGGKLLEEINLKKRIEKEVEQMKINQNSNPVIRGEEIIKEVEALLYPLLEGWTTSYVQSSTAANLYLDLLIIENNLLVKEVKYTNMVSSTDSK